MDGEKIVENMKAVLKATRKTKKKRHKNEKESTDDDDNDKLISDLMTKNWQTKSPLEKTKMNAFEKMMSKSQSSTSPKMENSVSKRKRGRPRKNHTNNNNNNANDVQLERIESDLSILDEDSLPPPEKSDSKSNGIQRFFSPMPGDSNGTNIEHSAESAGSRKRNRVFESVSVKQSTPKKRKEKENNVLLDSNENSFKQSINETSTHQSGRPRRSCTSKVDYSALLHSPDKESPEKKRGRYKSEIDSSCELVDIDESFSVKKEKANVKLAPVFIKKMPKPSIDPAILQARREFLLSELPSELRASIDKKKQFEDEIVSNELIAFPLVSHVTQLKVKSTNANTRNVCWLQSRIKINVNDGADDGGGNDVENAPLRLIKCGTLTDSHEKYHKRVPVKANRKAINGNERVETDIKAIVSEIKEREKSFPVNRCFKQLIQKHKSALSECDNENRISYQNSLFVDIFKPTSFNEFHIATQPIVQLKEFLTTWSERGKLEMYDSDDSNSRQSLKGSNNCVVLSGRNGTGKTSSVYALARDLNYEIIEINAGARRSGKKILQELYEATQSHRVENRLVDGDSSSDSTPNDTVQDKRTIILIEDAELAFETDEGFISSIQQLINISKRPVILTTNDRKCQHMQKFIQHNEIIYENPKHTAAKYLSLVCLASNYPIDEIEIEHLYALNGRDLRKTINEIEFFIRSDSARVNGGSLMGLYQHTPKECMPLQRQDEKAHIKLAARSQKDFTATLFESSIISECSLLFSRAQHQTTESDEISYHQHNLMNEMASYFQQSNVLQTKFQHDLAQRQSVISRCSIADDLCNLGVSNRAKALDYSPILRNICRSEKVRGEAQRRTSNRNHYLRFLATNNSFTSSYYDQQCEVLQSP